MGGTESGAWLRQVFGLFRQGTFGGLSDGQLLDRFVVSRRGDEAEASFEELMHRHGPMVLRICLAASFRHPHDAEDAVSGNVPRAGRIGAGSIRRRDSVASWLFGVSQRVMPPRPDFVQRVDVKVNRLRPSRRPRPACPATPVMNPRRFLEERSIACRTGFARLVVLFYLEGLTYRGCGS